MAQPEYRVVLTGEILDEFNFDEVVLAAAKLFKCSNERAQKLLGRKPVPLKQLMDQQTAEKYRSRLMKAGINCRIEELRKKPPGPKLELELDEPQAEKPEHNSPAVFNTQPQSTANPVSTPTLELMGDSDNGHSLDSGAGNSNATAFELPKDTHVTAEQSNFQCPKCQTPQPKGQECIHCGIIFAKYQGNPNPSQPIVIKSDDDDGGTMDEWDEISLFVGSEIDKYRMKFRELMNSDGKYKLQWHWAAFLVPVPWMIYRKLYFWAASFLLINLVLPLYGMLLLPFVAGLLGNYIYYRHVTHSIAKLNSIGDLRREEIINKGGTNSMLVTIGITIVAGLLMSLALYMLVLRPVVNETMDRIESDTAILNQSSNPGDKPTKVKMLMLKNTLVATKRLKTAIDGQFSMPATMNELKFALNVPSDAAVDAWGTEIDYEYIEQTMIFSSAGADKQWDTEDDIVIEVKE